MKKKEKEKIVKSMKYQRTERLKDIRTTFSGLLNNHEMAKRSYFWHPGWTARERRKNEADYTFKAKIKIGETVIGYVSNRRDTCSNIYWESYFWINMKDANINAGDISYLMDAITDIIKTRETKKGRKAK